MKVIVASVPGAGKTTILKFVKEKLPYAKIVHAGDLFFEIAKKKLKIKNRDEMRQKLSLKQQKNLQDEVMKKISKMKGKILFIDTHLSIKTPHGYFPAQSEKSMHWLKPDMIIVLEFRPEDVIERRKLDTSRQRDVETTEEISEHQKINRELAIAAAEEAESSISIIDLTYLQKKPFEHAMKAADEIVKLVKG